MKQQVSCHQNADDTPAGSAHNPDAPDGVCSASDAADAISGPYLNDQGSWNQFDRGDPAKYTVDYTVWSSNGDNVTTGSYDVDSSMN